MQKKETSASDILGDKTNDLKKRVNKLYIYGAGIFAQNVYKYLKKRNISVDGFVVTKIDTDGKTPLPTYTASETITINDGIIMGLNQHNSRQVLDYLKGLRVKEENIIDGGHLLENGGERLGFDGDAIMEITVRIGCPIECRFCPQKKLLQSYYRNDKKRSSEMDMETFRICLEKIPKDVGIVFSGFAEPLMHPECLDMMRIACNEGRRVDLFTTLTGIGLEAVRELVKLPLNYVGLHCADSKGYAKIPISEEYYEKVRWLMSSRKPHRDQLFVDFCNAQGQPEKEIEKIVSKEHEIGTTLFDRAGNLDGEGLVRKKDLVGRLECSMCGALVNRNVLLPDGTVVICCMDYGLKHPLGNLLRETYEEIQTGEEARRIRKGLSGDEAEDILCRKCSCAREVS